MMMCTAGGGEGQHIHTSSIPNFKELKADFQKGMVVSTLNSTYLLGDKP